MLDTPPDWLADVSLSFSGRVRIEDESGLPGGRLGRPSCTSAHGLHAVQVGIKPDPRKLSISESKSFRSARLRAISCAPATAAKIARALVSRLLAGTDSAASILVSHATLTSANACSSAFTGSGRSSYSAAMKLQRNIR